MDILRGSDELTDLVVGNGACSFANVTAFDLSVYPNLETLTIGNYSFRYASLELKSILIHYEMMCRHTQSHRCGSSMGIRALLGQ